MIHSFRENGRLSACDGDGGWTRRRKERPGRQQLNRQGTETKLNLSLSASYLLSAFIESFRMTWNTKHVAIWKNFKLAGCYVLFFLKVDRQPAKTNGWQLEARAVP